MDNNHVNSREQRDIYWALSPADKVLYVVDRAKGGSAVSTQTDPPRNRVHAGAAKALVARGVLEYTGPFDEYVQRVQA